MKNNFKPILFSSPMVQSILRGEKTQTRRIVKYPKKITDPKIGFSAFTDNGQFEVRGIHENGQYGSSFFNLKYKVGDIMWVRETWHPKRHSFPTGFPFEYRATAEQDGTPTDEPWKPSIFMPKEACRIFLKVINVRVERLNDISESDAIAEGIERKYFVNPEFNGLKLNSYKIYGTNNEWDENPINSYYSLWEKINGKGSWAINPFVWVYEFEITDINFNS